MRAFLKPLAVATALALAPAVANAFCGFYVAGGDAKLFNEASKVVMVRDRDRTVITMVNDFKGDVKEFAMVVPAPTVLKRKQINVTENAIVDHLDAYTAPRLVEYFDENPCAPIPVPMAAPTMVDESAATGGAVRRRGDAALGVKVEAEYTVGEYDIVILSAKESDGLTTWLKQNGYRIPDGAEDVLGSYIGQDMKFFVAKVNLQELAKSGNTFLRPLQIAFESKKFMLPIRLGTVNSRGKQDLLLWTLTRKGRVETANYRTERMPTGQEIPTFVKKEFGPVYKAIYGTAIERTGGAGVLLEYAWDMAWCDPCAADPLSARELKALGVYWVDGDTNAGADVFVTRLHARYDAKSFPEDLRLIETGDRNNFQGRYVMRHPWTGNDQCPAADEYRRGLRARFDREAQALANLTGWDIGDIRKRMSRHIKATTASDTDWIDRLWHR